MKTLLIDCSWEGHHRKYFKCIYDNVHGEKICILPEQDSEISNIVIVKYIDNLRGYYSYVRSIKRTADRFEPDTIVFLYADIFYKYFGLGLGFLKKYHCVLVFHCMQQSPLRDASRRLISKNASQIIVHLPQFEKYLKRINIENVTTIQYPNFWSDEELSHYLKQRKKDERINLLLIGALREEKGYRLLLQAASGIKSQFRITIAGDASGIDREALYSIAEKEKNIDIVDKYLTEEEYIRIMANADYMVLPYMRRFSGASGPLTEAVAMGIPIIAADLPTIGRIVEENHLGYVFIPEDVEDLIKTINSISSKTFVYDEVACEYQKTISLKTFTDAFIAIIEK